MKVGLIGNPNSGKTTMFNELTGSLEHVGNWHGVTVSSKQAELVEKYKQNNNMIEIVDLPGTYSLNPYTSEEVVTRDFIEQAAPDIIINIIESTNLKRSLFLTTQLLELDIPIIIAVNKIDELEKEKIKIDITKMSSVLNCPVILTSGFKDSDNGLNRLMRECVMTSRFKKGQRAVEIPGINLEQNDEKSYSTADKLRHRFIKDFTGEIINKKPNQKQLKFQNKLDSILTHKWLGLLIFALIIYLVFYISQVLIGPFFAEILVSFLEKIQNAVALFFAQANPILLALLVDGIIGGVIAVMGFLPLIMVMFFLMALLEDCGYMARVAVVMDRFFKRIGLSGRSIIPLIIGSACSIPGIMSARTIKNDRQRKTTAMLTPFIPCGAKLPVIALFSTVFFTNSALLATSIYFLALLIIAISALIIRRITHDTSKNYFILELPDYRIPSFKRAYQSMLNRAWAFIKKATTIILLSNVIIQLLQTSTFSLTPAVNPDESILAVIAHPVAILLIPLGFGTWQFAAATITGFIAKENVVGTLAVVFSLTNLIDPQLMSGPDTITAAGALAFLIFNLFTPPCIAAIGALRTELNDRHWLFGALLFQLYIGYSAAFLVYQFGSLLMYGTFGTGFIYGLLLIALASIYLGYLMYFKKEIDA